MSGVQLHSFCLRKVLNLTFIYRVSIVYLSCIYRISIVFGCCMCTVFQLYSYEKCYQWLPEMLSIVAQDIVEQLLGIVCDGCYRILLSGCLIVVSVKRKEVYCAIQ